MASENKLGWAPRGKDHLETIIFQDQRCKGWLCFPSLLQIWAQILESNFWSPSLWTPFLDLPVFEPHVWEGILQIYIWILQLATVLLMTSSYDFGPPFLFTWQNAPTSYRHQMGISEASTWSDDKITNEKQKQINAKCSTNTMNTCVYYKSSIISCMHIIFHRWGTGSCFHMYHEFRKIYRILPHRMQTLLFQIS